MRRRVNIALSAVAVAAASVFVVPATAHAAGPGGLQSSRLASEATAYQNATIENALARVPSGTRVSASEAEWPNGMILVAAASAHAEAPLSPAVASQDDDIFCGYTGPGYTGSGDCFQGPGTGSYWEAWGELMNAGMVSWFNNTPARVWREQFQNSGNELCVPPYSEMQDYSGANVNDYWVLMTSNDSGC
jgi:hypothetical protein